MNPGLVVKLRPAGPWRIGPDSGARNRVDVIYHSDSLFSAVTSALARLGLMEEWLQATARDAAPAVSFSSCYPFLDEIGLVVPPRTVWPPKSPSLASARVRWKSARFVPLDVVRAVLAGEPLNSDQWIVDGASECLVPAGRGGPFRTGIRWNAAVDRLTGASERHATACIEFRAGSGLWTIAGFRDEPAHARWLGPVKAAFRLLADTGFGGERSRGWGRSGPPEFIEGSLPEMILPLRGTGPGPGDQGPGAGDQGPRAGGPGAGEPGPGAGSQGLGAGDQGLGAAGQGLGTADQGPGAGDQGPGAGDQRSGAGDQSPGVAHQGPGAGYQALVAAGPAPGETGQEIAAAGQEIAAEGQEIAAEEVSLSRETGGEPSPVPPIEEPPKEPPPVVEPPPLGPPSPDPDPHPPAPEPEPDPYPPPFPGPSPVIVAPAGGAQAHWLLSLFTPAPADSVDWGRGNYAVLARGGRIESPAGSGELKKQVQMVVEGSVLYAAGAPHGTAADVAPDGFAHPVFRAGFALAIPLPGPEGAAS